MRSRQSYGLVLRNLVGYWEVPSGGGDRGSGIGSELSQRFLVVHPVNRAISLESSGREAVRLPVAGLPVSSNFLITTLTRPRNPAPILAARRTYHGR